MTASPLVLAGLVALAVLLGGGRPARRGGARRWGARRWGAARASAPPHAPDGQGSGGAPGRGFRGARGGAGARAGGGPPAARPVDVPLAMDLLAAVLQAGAATPGALEVVGTAVAGPDGARLRVVAHRLRLGATTAQAWDGAGARWDELRDCLELAEASGAPTAALLRQAATRERTERAHRQLAAARRLGVRVLLPLGLCALPGFAALGVAPVVLALVGSFLDG